MIIIAKDAETFSGTIVADGDNTVYLKSKFIIKYSLDEIGRITKNQFLVTALELVGIDTCSIDIELENFEILTYAAENEYELLATLMADRSKEYLIDNFQSVRNSAKERTDNEL